MLYGGFYYLTFPFSILFWSLEERLFLHHFSMPHKSAKHGSLINNFTCIIHSCINTNMSRAGNMCKYQCNESYTSSNVPLPCKVLWPYTSTSQTMFCRTMVFCKMWIGILWKNWETKKIIYFFIKFQFSVFYQSLWYCSYKNFYKNLSLGY